ncbi:MAG: zinc ribbon domain-containing protein [Ruminococcus sp.]|nr:zinc ribbon domain-containing protein [Ruminococcus sp.]
MKKTFSFILCLVILIFSVVGVSAKTDPEDLFYIEELGFTIEIPLYDSVTKNVNELDLSQSEYEQWLKDFEEDGIYYYGCSDSYYWYNIITEIIIYGFDSDLSSFSNLSDSRMKKIIENHNKGWEESEVTVVKSEIFESLNATYILTHFTDDEGNYAINYYTVENYKEIDIVMWSYGGEPPANARQNFLRSINTIEFDEPTGMQIYEKTFTLSIAENGKLTPLGESLILTCVIVLVQIIAGVVVLIILLNKRKKRRQNALTQNANIKTKFCIYCGTELNTGDTFCHKCGKNQIPYEEKENINP